MLNIFKISYTTIFIVFLFTNSIICIIIVVLSFVLIEKTPNKEKLQFMNAVLTLLKNW